MTKSFYLRSKFETYGAFWVPEDPSRSFTGRLARTQDGIQLTSSPIFSKIDWSEEHQFPGPPESFDVLHGQTTDGPCTLYYIQSTHPAGLTDHRIGKSLRYRQYRVGLCVFGQQLPGFQTPFAGSVTFSYTGLKEWIPVHPQMSRTDDSTMLTHAADLPAVFDACSRALQARIKLEIYPRLQQHSSGEYETRHDAQLSVEPMEPRSLEWFVGVGYRFEHLFSLLLGTSVVQKALAINAENKIGWLVRKTNRKPEKPDRSVWIRCTTSQLLEATLCWLDTPPEFQPFENLIYGTIRQSSLFVETEFLSLAQAVESFHRLTDRSTVTESGVFKAILRKLEEHVQQLCGGTELGRRLSESIQHANEPSFRTRIERLLTRLNEEQRTKLLGVAEEFEKTLRHTRNHLTHPGIKKKTHVLTDTKELFLFNEKLHAFLRLLMLVHIGLPADRVFDPVLQQATKWT